MTKLPDATANYLFDTCGYVMHRAHFDEPTVRELREQLERVWPADASGAYVELEAFSTNSQKVGGSRTSSPRRFASKTISTSRSG